LRIFSFGGYGLALAALALVLFGAYDSYPEDAISGVKRGYSWRQRPMILKNGFVTEKYEILC